MTPHLFIHVQHLLGIGHMERAFAVAGASMECGFGVTIATGRRSCSPESRFQWVPLPDVRSADAGFSVLLDENDAAATDALWARRREALLDGFRQTGPSVLLVEGFPFARRRFRTELLPLLALARERGIPVLCSVRDILQPKNKPDRIDDSVDWANDFFDLILVHGDPSFAGFEETFSAANRLTVHIVYTGYVSKPDGPDDGATGRDEVVVSAGGGAVGQHLFETALAAARLPGAADRHWRLLVGRNMADGAAASDLPGHVTVEPARDDFRSLLRRAAVSVSQAGYNTAVDLFASGAPAILVPFADGGQREQAMRAERMADVLGAVVLAEDSLTPEALLAAVRSQAGNRRETVPVDLAGAERSARLLSLCHAGDIPAAARNGLTPKEGMVS